MTYTQQEIVRIWRLLTPSITESAGKIKISIRGRDFTVDKRSADSRVVSVKNIAYH